MPAGRSSRYAPCSLRFASPNRFLDQLTLLPLAAPSVRAYHGTTIGASDRAPVTFQHGGESRERVRMRYRHLRYRYTVVVTSGQSQAIADFWRIGGSGMVMAHPRWRPDADVYETPTDVVVTVDLAGADENEMEVLLFEDALVVEGRRSIPGCEPGGEIGRA